MKIRILLYLKVLTVVGLVKISFKEIDQFDLSRSRNDKVSFKPSNQNETPFRLQHMWKTLENHFFVNTNNVFHVKEN